MGLLAQKEEVVDMTGLAYGLYMRDRLRANVVLEVRHDWSDPGWPDWLAWP
jgi:hypothetical protein